MDSEKKAVRVTIYGQAYTLLAAEDPRAVEELADAVGRLMENIAARSGTADPARVAVLTCLHLADRLRTLERELDALRHRVERKAEQFSLLLDQALEG